MNSLVLGDIVFDPRRVIFVKSLKALVCAGLRESAQLSSIVESLIETLEHYKAESLIVTGCSLSSTVLEALREIQKKGVRVSLVSQKNADQAVQNAEALGFEVHQELVWGKYRFVEVLEHGAVELYFVSAIGGSGEDELSYSVRVGRSGLGGIYLPVFLKGLGQVMLPSVNPACKRASVFRKSLSRYDVFAVGHHRVFPLGKVADLREVRTLGQIPLSPRTLGSKRYPTREK